ncbi:MAG: hypothetical protein COV74_09260 [Candidatus Omnitrophica bacterium CG11_big_fil_rev_8_21_14_0_20_45_26]|uniref:Methyltransferase type 11 domain-containing protein n=1 Tax=Candidatus Abzuiibacterium crystallinum TaxID=1974748 RepID=A0A2H0LLX5_9BACT|nr:MAG: hypothetical protein COV74_09260 [Candidatus Omnitrophica bacterium CG11_big_fil_rev_8_21_14_0_20_45_26]PIW63259.1 MAG: hypothetical protein COW12_11235 [Candidatus Omnitrophica bacterium CG12_big_fil_rev_8_21_14_0_65_45_16]
MNIDRAKSKFEHYAETHPMGGPVSDFEREFYQKYLQGLKGNIVDIGCGDGKYISYFHQITENAGIYACDISLKRVQRVKAHGYAGFVGSAETLPLRNQSVDWVFLMQVLEHVSNPECVIAECERVLAPQGCCLILVPNYPAKRIYDWINMVRHQKWHKWLDDPTHCTKLNHLQLHRLLSNHFSRVDIYPTFIYGEGRLRFIQEWKTRRRSVMWAAHKLLAVCRRQ